MGDNLIFGRTWEDIQSMQQGKYTAPKVDMSKSGKQPATDADRELLRKHGFDGLEKMGFFGVIDRLKNTEEEQ